MIETGCVIDASHTSPRTLDLEIIKYAEMNGWDGGSTDIDRLIDDYCNVGLDIIPDDYDGHPQDFEVDVAEALYFAAEDAVEWLNDNTTHDGYYYTVDDNSLYYWKVDDEDV